MDAVAARGYVEERAMGLSAEGFELLCESVLSETLPPATFSVTPFRQDGGIDIDGTVRTALLDVSLGVQVKQYASSSTVGSPAIQRFQGALRDSHCDTGTVITSSSFTQPAISSATTAGIHLVDGETLFEAMVEQEVGVRRSTDSFETNDPFWSLFDDPDTTGLVSTKRIPLANEFETLDSVLAAIESSRGSKSDIVTRATVSSRHADLYAIAGWILGFVHQEWPDEDGENHRRWSLTRAGAKYVHHRANGRDEEAERLLVDAIRRAEIVARARDELRESTELPHTRLVDIVERESELSASSARRRGSSVGAWLARLPEVSVENGHRKTYVWNA